MSTIKILSGGAMKSLMVDVVPLFERANGTKAEIRFALTSVLKKEIEDGVAFDIALLPRPELDALVEAGKIAAGTQTDITRSAVGLAVRAGAPKPDISTVDAFKRTLMAAKSVAYIDPAAGGSSGIYVGKLLERLGIAAAVNAKAKLIHGGAVADHIAAGEAEIGVHQISEILAVKGAVLVGPLPADIQNFTVYAAGIGTAAKHGASALVKFLAGPHAGPIIKAKGMEPAS